MAGSSKQIFRVWKTGFHVIDLIDYLDITGTRELSRQQAWSDGMQANPGTVINQRVPNFFILLGPHTGLGQTRSF